jgi:ATP-dependent helicase HrpA
MIDPEQDRRRCHRVAPFLARLNTLGSIALCSPPVIDYCWLVEEYRVSVFAQELKTSRPVSSDRLEKQWQQVMRSDRTT